MLLLFLVRVTCYFAVCLIYLRLHRFIVLCGIVVRSIVI